MAVKELRESKQSNKVVGLLKEMNLEVKDAKMTMENGEEKDTKAIRGYIVISAMEKDIKIKLNQKKIKKNGEQNKLYKGYATIMDTYVSMADVLNKYKDLDLPDDWKTEVTVVKCYPKFGEQAFNTDSGFLVYTDLQGMSINSEKGAYTETATFQLEGYFSKIVEEVDEEQEETGRLLVEMIITTWGGRAFPLDLVAQDEVVVEYILENYEVGLTGTVWGDIDFTETEKVSVVKGFGKDLETKSTKFKKELVIEGGAEEQYDEDDDLSLDKDLIKKAMNERAIFHDERRNEGSGESKNNKKGFTPKPKTKAKKNVTVDDDDLPF